VITIRGIEFKAGRAHVGFAGISTVPLRAGYTIYLSLWPNRIGWYFYWCREHPRKAELRRAIR
jgi:hypothetical protein